LRELAGIAGIDVMTDTKELLQRIAALRQRLNQTAEPTLPTRALTSAADPLRVIEERIHKGAHQSAMIDRTIQAAEPSAASVPSLVKLTARGARLLRHGREMLQALRKVSEHAEFQAAADDDIVADLHREAAAMLENLLRTAQSFPPTVSLQLRMCDGLEVVGREIEERIGRMCNLLAQRQEVTARINGLADYLQALAAEQPVGLAPLQAWADAIVAEARAGSALRFLHASATEPTRFAAAHSINVAQVLARLLFDDPDWQPQLQLAVMAALVHDVGMVCVPADVLMTQGPLDADERRLIEKHTTVAEAMLAKLWPGGGWPIEAARDHHERNDGTGYPLGQQGMQLSEYARLLAVCDVYAALCAPRPHRPAFDTRTALTETLMLAEREFLDAASAERLLRLSFYPVGSAVELNDGAIALVIATHAGTEGMTNPGRPIVQIVLDADGASPAWPMVIDLLHQTEHSILRSLRPDERSVMLAKHCPHAA
jgi:response regulator RpfG family c-di-GMP phosphodiesterase